MGSSGYLARQKAAVDVYRQAEKDTTIQFMTDTLILTLRDPAVMGKDVWGRQRLEKLVKAWGETYDKYHTALGRSDEADYYQEKMDSLMREFMGDDLVPFRERYDWVQQFGYDKPVSKPKKKRKR